MRSSKLTHDFVKLVAIPGGRTHEGTQPGGNCRMISVLLEMSNGKGLSEAVSAQIRQAVQFSCLSFRGQRSTRHGQFLRFSFPEMLNGTLERDGYSRPHS